MKIAECFPSGWKILWEKEKLLVTSNFSFSHSVFKRLVLQTRKNQGLFGKGLKGTCFRQAGYPEIIFLHLCPFPNLKFLQKVQPMLSISASMVHFMNILGLVRQICFSFLKLYFIIIFCSCYCCRCCKPQPTLPPGVFMCVEILQLPLVLQ